jgi:hypothetical protein
VHRGERCLVVLLRSTGKVMHDSVPQPPATAGAIRTVRRTGQISVRRGSCCGRPSGTRRAYRSRPDLFEPGLRSANAHVSRPS